MLVELLSYVAGGTDPDLLALAATAQRFRAAITLMRDDAFLRHFTAVRQGGALHGRRVQRASMAATGAGQTCWLTQWNCAYDEVKRAFFPWRIREKRGFLLGGKKEEHM